MMGAILAFFFNRGVCLYYHYYYYYYYYYYHYFFLKVGIFHILPRLSDVPVVGVTVGGGVVVVVGVHLVS